MDLVTTNIYVYWTQWLPILLCTGPTDYQYLHVLDPVTTNIYVYWNQWLQIFICTGPSDYQYLYVLEPVTTNIYVYWTQWLQIFICSGPSDYQYLYVLDPVTTNIYMHWTHWLPIFLCPGPSDYQYLCVLDPVTTNIYMHWTHWLPIFMCTGPSGYQYFYGLDPLTTNTYMYWTQLNRRLITLSPEEGIRSNFRNVKFIFLYFWNTGNWATPESLLDCNCHTSWQMLDIIHFVASLYVIPLFCVTLTRHKHPVPRFSLDWLLLPRVTASKHEAIETKLATTQNASIYSFYDFKSASRPISRSPTLDNYHRHYKAIWRCSLPVLLLKSRE